MSSERNVKKIKTVGGDGFVTVLKYAVVEEDGKYLVPLFFNNVNKPLDSLEFYIEEYDESGKSIAKNKVTTEKIGAEPKSVFGGDFKIKLSDACADVKITVERGKYGNFERVNERSGVVLSYEKNRKRYSDKEICERADGKSYNKKHLYKSNFLPGLIISLAAVLLLSVSFFCYLNRFAATENSFLHGGCVYEFVDRENENTVRLVGTKGYKRKVVVPEYIGDYKVLEIAKDSFSNERFIEEIEIQGCPEIKDGAFENCDSLRIIDLGKVTAVGNNAFYYCLGLTEVRSPYLERIGDDAFFGCAMLQTVQTAEGKSVTLGRRAFYGCGSLRSFVCMSDLKVSGDKQIFRDCGQMEVLSLKELPGGATTVSELFGVNIPYLREITLGKLDVISDGFCKNYSNLRKITIKELADGNIGSGAFSGCFSLSEFNVNVSITSVGNDSFRNTMIPSFEGENIEKIGEYAFADNTALTEFTLNESIVGLPTGVFKGCTALKEIALPKECVEIGENAFKNCASLEKAVLPEALKSIGDSAFSGCSNLKKVVIPSSTEYIGRCAFEYCASLTEANVPSNVSFLGEDMFYGCESLKQLSLPYVGSTADDTPGIFYFFGNGGYYRPSKMPNGLKKIIVKSGNVYPSIFKEAAYVEEIVFLEKVKSIGEGAFYGCASLKKANFLNDVETVGDKAFARCSALEEIKISDSTEFIGSAVFVGCRSLETLSVPFLGRSVYESETLYYLFSDYYDETAVPSALKHVTIGRGESIAPEAFARCSSVESITLPSSLLTISDRAFYECAKLKAIDLPTTVSHIGAEAFYGCYSLSSITLPSSLTEIGDDAFSSCYRLYKVYNRSRLNVTAGVAGSNGSVGENALYVAKPGETIPEGVSEDGFAFMRSDKKELYLIGYEGTASELQFPSHGVIDGTVVGEGYIVADYAFAFSDDFRYGMRVTVSDGVRKIGKSAFYDCELNELSFFGSTIEEIGEYAFSSCRSLQKVELSAGAYISVLGDNAFFMCTRLEKIAFYDGSYIKEIGNYAFAGSRLNGELTLPENLTVIGDSAFFDCSEIDSVSMPSSLATLGQNAFGGCTSLTSANLPSGIKSINDGVFALCVSLSSVELHDGITAVGATAFKGCLSLTDVKFSGKIRSIGIEAFSGCSALKNVYIDGTLNALGKNAFSGCSSLESIKLSFSLKAGIPENAFSGCTSLKSAELKGINAIRRGAFADCSSLEEIILPVGLTSIKEEAFLNCSSLELIQLPSTLKSVSENAFLNCCDLYEIYNLSSLALTLGDSGNGRVAEYAYVIHKNANEARMGKLKTRDVTFIKPGETWKMIKFLPETSRLELGDFEIDGVVLDEYEIKDGLFNGLDIEEAVIGAAVTGIGYRTFADCYVLQKVTFDPNSKITEIPDEAFYCCGSLTEVAFPDSVKSIGRLAFSGCNLYETEKLPASLKDINDGAFMNTSLRCVFLPESLEYISNDAFAYCMSLYEVYNMSALDIKAGDSGYGCVALNAYIVNTDANAPRMVYELYGDFNFLKFGGKWYLHSSYYFHDIIDLPRDFELSGEKITGYTVMENAFSSFPDIKIVIPECVSEIRSGAFYGNKIAAAFLFGSAEAANKLLRAFTVGEKYFYADCVHEKGQWTYTNGNVDVDVKEFVIKEKTDPTCTEDGKIVYECPYCKATETKVGKKATGHVYDENGICEKCGEKEQTSARNAAKPDSYRLPKERVISEYRRYKSKKKVSE